MDMQPQTNPHQNQQKKLMEALKQHPEIVQQIVAEIKNDNMSIQELQQLQQGAMQALQNPQSYPQLRQQAIQQGSVNPEDLPEQYDEKLVASLAIAAMIGLEAQQGQQAQQPAPLKMPSSL